MVQWLGLCAFTVKDLGSILSQGTKIPQAVWHGQKIKKIITFINNQVLLYSTGNYIQSPGINHNRQEYLKKENINVLTKKRKKDGGKYSMHQ